MKDQTCNTAQDWCSEIIERGTIAIRLCITWDIHKYEHNIMETESQRALEYLTEIEEAAEDVLANKQQVISITSGS